jgi:hypothetical protein
MVTIRNLAGEQRKLSLLLGTAVGGAARRVGLLGIPHAGAPGYDGEAHVVSEPESGLRQSTPEAPRRPVAPMGDKYLSREEAAAHLGEAPKTLANWVGAPSKPQPSAKAGSRVWYLESALDRYDAERRGVPPSATSEPPSIKPPRRRLGRPRGEP